MESVSPEAQVTTTKPGVFTGQSQPVKRKADDMESDEEEHMALPVKKNGGTHRPFARKKELRDLVLGHGVSSNKASTSSQSQVSEGEQSTRQAMTNGHSQEAMEVTSQVGMVKTKENTRIKFEHSNTSPFKNFHLEPSSSTAGADLSATAQTPRENSEVPGSSYQTNHQGAKRSNNDPDPSCSRTTEKELNSVSAAQIHAGDKASVGGSSPRLMPNRGNVATASGSHTGGFGANSELNRDRTEHWTTQLPKVNVAAAEKRFEGVSNPRHSPAPSTSDWRDSVLRHHGDRFSFMLADLLNVHVCYDDVTRLRTDALVNPTDGQLTHVNDIARSIAMATGPQMTNQCQFFLRQNGGPLETTEVVETYACGSLSGRVGHVVHLAMPMFDAANEKSSLSQLMKSYLNCLSHVNDHLGLVSVVFPCVGAGSYPQDSCINVFFEALLVHLAERKYSRIKTVKFVTADVHLANLAIAMIQSHLERSILEGVDVLMAEALNSFYGNSKWECNQNDINDQLGRQLEVDSSKKLFRGPPVKRPRL